MGALVSLLLVLTGCPLCGRELIKEVPSPDGKYIAAVFESDCGATTPFSRQVLLRKGGTSFSGEDKEGVVFRVRGKEDIEVRWVDVGHLMVRRFPNRDAIFKELGDWHGVKVVYVADWLISP